MKEVSSQTEHDDVALCTQTALGNGTVKPQSNHGRSMYTPTRVTAGRVPGYRGWTQLIHSKRAVVG